MLADDEKNVYMANFVPMSIEHLEQKTLESAQVINNDPKLLASFFHHAKLKLWGRQLFYAKAIVLSILLSLLCRCSSRIGLTAGLTGCIARSMVQEFLLNGLPRHFVSVFNTLQELVWIVQQGVVCFDLDVAMTTKCCRTRVGFYKRLWLQHSSSLQWRWCTVRKLIPKNKPKCGTHWDLCLFCWEFCVE